MRFFRETRHSSATVVVAIVLTLVGSALALAQPREPRRGQDAPARWQYLHREVPTEALAQTLNTLDQQGWETLQVAPGYELNIVQGTGTLNLFNFHVVARRSIEEGRR